MTDSTPILEMRNVTKTFPGVVANRDVSLAIGKGEFHAIVGENGAGKTTLMKIAGGLYPPDSGEVLVEGVPRHFRSPLDAFRCGIAMVHQEFMLLNQLTVLENTVLGFEPADRLGFLDRKAAMARGTEVARKYGLRVPWSAKVGGLSVAVRQQVEIVKALYKEAKILILDEPTAVLTPQETEDLYRALRLLKDLGTTIIFITHKLKEVLGSADRVTVMRHGMVQGTLPVAEVDEQKLARMMVGRDVVFRIRKVLGEAPTTDPILEVSNVGWRDDADRWALRNISLTVRRGEILGVAGVVGNGQRELVEVVTGLRKPSEGHISLTGNHAGSISAAMFRQHGSHVPQDRRGLGCSLRQSLWENTLIGLQGKPQFSNRLGFLRRQEVLSYADNIIRDFDVRAPSVDTWAEHLSGGNLQKLILGRELARKPLLLVAHDPTRGLDVGATEYVRNRILEFTSEGRGVLLVSQDLNEILTLSDRIIIIYNGEIVGEVPGRDAAPELLGLYMMGLKRDESGNGGRA